MQIWIFLNGIQQGPYTEAQLKTMNISPDTPVWYAGLPQWLPASQATATAAMFNESAHENAANISRQTPPETVEHSTKDVPKKPSTYLVWNILMLVLCCCPLAIIGIVTGSITSSRYVQGNYDGARRMSEVTEWILILSVVWIVLFGPVMMAVSLL